MFYLIGQILFLLLLTALMSGAMGWLLRSLNHEAQTRQAESEWTAKMTALRRARDDYRDQLEQLQSGGAALVGEATGGELDDEQRARVIAHVRQLEEEVHAGRERLASLTRKLEGVIEASAQRESEFNTLREQLDAATAAVRERDARLEAFSAKVTDAARQQTENARSTQREMEERTHELEQTVEVQKLRIRELEAATTEEQEPVEHGKLLTVIQAQKKTIESLNHRIRQQGSQAADPNELSATQVLRERENAIRALQERLRETTRRAEAAAEIERDNVRLEQTLAERDEQLAELDQLRAELAVRPHPSVQEELIERLKIRDETIANLQNQLRQISTADTHDEDENRYARMMEVVRAQEETIARLNERLRRQRDLPPAAPRTVVARATATPVDTLSGDLFEDRPTTILDAPDGDPDNLQRIHGVGPILEGKLNELGVYHFRQIASFGDEEIAWISTHMSSFPNRIIRDRWIDQAERLERERVGGP